jgi:hypothetical protein
VKLGKIMWNITVKANCSRANWTGSKPLWSIVIPRQER